MNKQTTHTFPSVWRRISILVLVCGAFFQLTTESAFAGGRPADTSRIWFGEFGGGWAAPTGNTMDDGWTINGGAMYWPESWKVGLIFDVAYSDFDFSNETLNSINDLIDADPDNDGMVTGGGVSNWKFGVNGIWGPGANANGLYVTGGVSINFLKGKLTETGLVYYPPICDPWYWWWCIPGGIGTGDIVVASDSTEEFGYNLGIGWNFETQNGQIYVEAKYETIDTGEATAHYVPVTIGLRF